MILYRIRIHFQDRRCYNSTGKDQGRKVKIQDNCGCLVRILSQ